MQKVQKVSEDWKKWFHIKTLITTLYPNKTQLFHQQAAKTTWDMVRHDDDLYNKKIKELEGKVADSQKKQKNIWSTMIANMKARQAASGEPDLVEEALDEDDLVEDEIIVATSIVGQNIFDRISHMFGTTS